MTFSKLLRATLLVSCINSIASSPVPNYNNDLKPMLSPTAKIFFPGSAGFANATTRWSADTKPGLDVIVQIASEKDVQATVRHCSLYFYSLTSS